MNRAADRLIPLAAAGRLYPSVIVSGGTPVERLDLALEVGRALLCEREPKSRPCGECKHCRRIVPGCCLTPLAPADGGPREPEKRKCRHCGKRYEGTRHPDLRLLCRQPRKDKPKTLELVIRKEQVREAIHAAQMAPYEARGQVVVVAEAQTLHYEAPDILLKTLEEPVGTTPRHFLLLAPSAQELLPTLRSRSLTVYLGAGDEGAAEDEKTAELVRHWCNRPGDDAFALWVAGLADRLLVVGGKELEDVRARRGWSRAARAAAEAAGALDDRRDRAAALALAADLLDAHRLRERYIQPRRIIEGLAARRLRRDRPETGFESSVNVLMGPP